MTLWALLPNKRGSAVAAAATSARGPFASACGVAGCEVCWTCCCTRNPVFVPLAPTICCLVIVASVSTAECCRKKSPKRCIHLKAAGTSSRSLAPATRPRSISCGWAGQASSKKPHLLFQDDVHPESKARTQYPLEVRLEGDDARHRSATEAYQALALRSSVPQLLLHGPLPRLAKPRS